MRVNGGRDDILAQLRRMEEVSWHLELVLRIYRREADELADAEMSGTVHTWKCAACGASGEIKHQPWMDGKEPAKWGLAVLDDIIRQHDRQSPNCALEGLEFSEQAPSNQPGHQR